MSWLPGTRPWLNSRGSRTSITNGGVSLRSACHSAGGSIIGAGAAGRAVVTSADVCVELLGQVLALPEDPQRALIDADRRVEHVVIEVADGGILGQHVIAPQVARGSPDEVIACSTGGCTLDMKTSPPCSRYARTMDSSAWMPLISQLWTLFMRSSRKRWPGWLTRLRCTCSSTCCTAPKYRSPRISVTPSWGQGGRSGWCSKWRKSAVGSTVRTRGVLVCSK